MYVDFFMFCRSKNEDIRSQSNLSSKKIKFCLKSDTKSLLHEMSEETDNIREDTDAEAKLLISTYLKIYFMKFKIIVIN